MSNRIQLRLIRELADVLGAAGVEFWLRGGGEQLRALLEPLGYVHAPEPNDRPELGLRLRKDGDEVAFVFVERSRAGALVTRGYEKWPWPRGMLDDPPRKLQGVTCNVMTVDALLDELERHHEWSDRPPRPKDIASLDLLRPLVRGGGEQ